MACYQKIHLEDEHSEAYLYSAGFSLRESCSNNSYWTCEEIYLILPKEYILRHPSALYSAIANQYQILGINEGKSEAIDQISNHFKNIVFHSTNDKLCT